MIPKGAKMVLHAVSARFARLLAAVCVTALSVLTVGAASARAAESSLTLRYTCAFPLIGSRSVTVTYRMDLPSSVMQGVPTSPSGATADIVLPAVVTRGLTLIGAATVLGSTVSDQSVTNGTARFGGPVFYTVPSTPLPASGAFTMHATGTFPSITFPNAGTAELTVGNLSLTLTPLNGRGKPTVLGTLNSACTQVPGQNNVLGTIPVLVPVTATTTAVASSANPSVQGQTVTYTATVRPAGVSGSVAFNDGGTPVTGCAARSLSSSGQAICQAAYVTTGSHAITAVYSGDAANAGSTSPVLTQSVVVDRADLKVTLSMPAQAADGAIVTQKVTVTNQGPATASTEVTALNEPSQLAVIDADGALVRGPLLTWSRPSLAPGATLTFTVTVQVGAHDHETVQVNVGALSITADPNMLNNFVFGQIHLG
jgi:Family of unknown function (DUF6801)/Bacterial Ig-like domain (group 3)/Domain of unknown function DUF11